MKFLHTADWHLNDRLGKIDRTESLRSRVEEVTRLCEEHRVDVLVHAGDLFSEQAEVTFRGNEVADSLRHLRRVFASFFARGGIHRTLKHDAVRKQTPLSQADADRVVGDFILHYNTVRLHSAIGYVTPHDVLAGRRDAIHTERDRKLEEARERRRLARQTARTIPTPPRESGATLTNESIPHQPLSLSTATANSNSG